MSTMLSLALMMTADVPPSPAPQAQESLPHMIKTEWSAAPPMPQGMQDNDGGIIDDYLVLVGGFCHGKDDNRKPGMYPRGFLKKAWALNLKNEAAGWIQLPHFPGAARQEMNGISVHNKIYLWGGFSDSEPYCYKTGYRLERTGGEWSWHPLPDMPYPGSAGSGAVIGSKIFLVGGMDYDAQRYYVSTDRTGEVKRFGARLSVFDTAAESKGWKTLKPCPGTPRMMSAMAASDGQLYLMGGYAVDDKGGAHNVGDSWRYDPSTDTWHRLRDLPVSVSGFSSGMLLYQNRYILLVTGYPHATIMNPDGSIRPRYGTPSRIDRSKWPGETGFNGSLLYENHVWVYDTHTDLYGTATYLPFDDHGQTMYILGDTMYLFPGETGGFYWEHEYFGHAAEFVLRGKMKALDWQR